MRTRIGWLVAVALALGKLALAPAEVRAQPPAQNYNYEVPPPPEVFSGPFGNLFPGPFGHARMEEGGFFVGVDGLYWRANNPLRDQLVATRGFVDFDGSILGSPGANIGGTPALDVNQVSGPGTFTPGFHIFTGWRFESGVVLTASWIHLVDVRYSAQATLVPPGFAVGQQLQNTFLFSPVVNFPIDFAGAPRNVGIGNLGATFGIWNAATEMQLQFLQRFEQGDIGGRIPFCNTEYYRNYGLLGGRMAWIWERFKWRTVDRDVSGVANESTTADYSNVVSNRVYGFYAGGGNEWFLGDTPIGAFSISIDGDVGLYLDFVKARAKYELEDRSASGSRNRNFQTLVPGGYGKLNLWWYPWESIQLTLGYDALVYFNTMASRRPIDFNYASITPGWDRGVTRLYHGVTFGFGITF
jgi:hypothetical protein